MDMLQVATMYSRFNNSNSACSRGGLDIRNPSYCMGLERESELCSGPATSIMFHTSTVSGNIENDKSKGRCKPLLMIST